MERKNLNIFKRGHQIQDGTYGKGPVVYLMSRDQRVEHNWALLYAQQEAFAAGCQLIVVFCLVKDYPLANTRHYSFMLEGLKDIGPLLGRKGISFRLLYGSPPDILPQFLGEHNAHSLIVDFDPLRIKRQWLRGLCSRTEVPIVEVDAHNVIPAWVVSPKKEYAAYTLRPKIHKMLPEYLMPFPLLLAMNHGDPPIVDEVDVAGLVRTIPQKLTEATGFVSGESTALVQMNEFIANRLDTYDEKRNNPNEDGQSNLSPYLHFGQLSAQYLALKVSESSATQDAKDSYLEELIVRRELADNFCLYEENYDRFAGFHPWAQKSLEEHREDIREHTYTLSHLEAGETHEELWNACQKNLVHHGKLHGFLRMYWAKKILEWTPSPELAMEYAIYLNDYYSLDGRDPNGYAGIAWSIGGIHDRAWGERSVFGKVRYMNLSGCKRKFDVDSYISLNI